MRCLMCEREYSDEHGESAESFCSESCRHVYEHLYSMSEVAGAAKLKA